MPIGDIRMQVLQLFLFGRCYSQLQWDKEVAVFHGYALFVGFSSSQLPASSGVFQCVSVFFWLPFGVAGLSGLGAAAFRCQ